MLRESTSGNVNDTVSAEPRLVPTQSVGINVVGSAGERRKFTMTKAIENVRVFDVVMVAGGGSEYTKACCTGCSIMRWKTTSSPGDFRFSAFFLRLRLEPIQLKFETPRAPKIISIPP